MLSLSSTTPVTKKSLTSLMSPINVVPAPMLNRDEREEALQLTLTPTRLRRLWLLILIVQMLYAFQLVLMADMYLQTSWQSSIPFLTFLTSMFLGPQERSFVNQYAPCIGATYAVLAACFMALILQMLWRTLRDRELSFGGFRRIPSKPAGQHNRVVRWIRICLTHYGIRGERFEEGFVVREGLEIFLQIWQAYATSKTISTKFVNQSFSIIIAVSAITHPVLSRLYARHVVKKRFGYVLTEFFLDITWSSILPLCVFVNYWHVDRTLTVERLLSTFPFGSYELAQREIRHLVILTWSQFFLAIIPATSALINLLSVVRILASAQVKESSSPSVVLDSGRLVVTSSMRTRTLIIALAASQRKPAFVRWGHRLITVGGIGICLTSIAATSMFESTGRIPDTSCGFRLYPWFVTDDACVVIALSCAQLQISGDSQELNSVFTTIDVTSIGLLILSDCPGLVMPTALARATSLTALILTNSTIVDWPMDIAFTTASFPPLRLLSWNGIRLPSPPPDALVKVRTWPETLERVRFAGTDIDELTQRLTIHWYTVFSLICIDCGLVTFPSVFFAMPKLERWVVWNSRITEIPTLYSTTETALWPSLRIVLWTHNTRLSSVGDDVWRAVSSGSVHTLSLASTGIQDVPVHWRTRLPTSGLVIHGYDSPLCATNTSFFIATLDCTAFDTSDLSLLLQ